MIQGTMNIYAHDKLLESLSVGDAMLVYAGETHAVRNLEDRDAIFVAITVPPLAQTH